MDRLPVADDVYSMPYDDAFLLGWNTAADQLRGFCWSGAFLVGCLFFRRFGMFWRCRSGCLMMLFVARFLR